MRDGPKVMSQATYLPNARARVRKRDLDVNRRRRAG
jgi:hypothetical protein